jgi:HD-like signal output (HDOD) protein
MPELGRRILELRADDKSDAAKLAKIVELDPSLAAQVIRYAMSSYYGYKGRITNVQDAIARVLGYDMTMNMVIGLAAGRSLRIPEGGRLGLSRFWEHSVMSAALAEKIIACIPGPERPPAGLGYLGGLLHDFGILLLGHLFPPEFRLLNRLATANPVATVSDLENQLLGMGGAREVLALGHAHMGALLMEAWKMPEPVCVSLREHHNPGYRGDHQVLVHAIQLADALLGHTSELPDAAALPEQHLRVLRLDPEQVLGLAESVFEARGTLLALTVSLTKAS